MQIIIIAKSIKRKKNTHTRPANEKKNTTTTTKSIKTTTTNQSILWKTKSDRIQKKQKKTKKNLKFEFECFFLFLH